MRKSIILIMLLCTSLSYVCAQKDVRLKFDSKGEFKVAQFTDIHWDEKESNCKETIEVIQHVLNTEKPDLAILTGDIVIAPPARAGWQSIAKIFTEAKIPWAVLMGNHDAEQDVSREEIYSFLKEQACYVGDIGPKDIHGTGNFVLSVMASNTDRVASAIYCLDSNDYTTNPLKLGNYDWIHFDQIQWYRNSSLQFTDSNNGKPLPALAYFHIPLPEYNESIQGKTFYGAMAEGKASSADINSGMFSSIVEMGDIMGTFVGHDHDNSFIDIKNDVALAYGRVSGLNAYGKLERGARIVKLYEDQFKFDTWITTRKGVEDMYYYPLGMSQEEEDEMEYLKNEITRFDRERTSGVSYTYYEYDGKIKSVDELVSNAKKIKTGTLKNFSLSPAKREDYFGFEFNCWIKIPETGVYNFYTYSDDGSKLFFADDILVVDNDGSHNARRRDGRIALRAGYHRMRVLYFESYMGEKLEIGITSKNIPEMIIPDEMLFVPQL